MHTNDMKLEIFKKKLAWIYASTIFLLLLLGLLFLVAGFAESSFAQASQPKTFTSPGAASNALFEAAQKQDEQALEAILGAGKEVTSSSDEIEDKLEREQFSRKYQEMHRLVQEADGSAVLYIGAENWPFPIPLVAKNGVWYFDSETGTDEIKFRRIGENEAIAIQVCEEFAVTKNEKNAGAVSVNKAKAHSEDPVTRFAESLSNGDNVNDSNGSTLFHGYYFRTMTADAGTNNSRFVVDGKKRAGVVLVAYPADYQSSGVQTFIVTQGALVFEKDLGPNTVTAAPSIKTRTSSWHFAN